LEGTQATLLTACRVLDVPRGPAFACVRARAAGICRSARLTVRAGMRMLHLSFARPLGSPDECVCQVSVCQVSVCQVSARTPLGRRASSLCARPPPTAQVLTYAEEISARGVQRSVMEIDDRWQRAYGDLEFDPVKFPDPKAMVDRLHALGFKVTAWVMPFAEERSAAYK
jgi:Glycosyl hydrolases family 31